MKNKILLLLMTLLLTACFPTQKINNGVSYDYNNLENVFPRNVPVAFAFGVKEFKDKKLGKFVEYRFRLISNSLARVYLYPDYLSKKKTAESEIDDSVYVIKGEARKVGLDNINIDNRVLKKKIESTVFLSQKILLGKNITEHIYVSRFKGYVLKIRATTPSGKREDEFVGRFISSVAKHLMSF